MVTSIDQLDLNRTYTYADYLLWQLKEKIQLFKGKIFAMSPAPKRIHQDISRRLVRTMLGVFDEECGCKLYYAPFDVRLSENTVVQPDVCVICDTSKLDERGCKGAPDLVVEILSPTNTENDTKQKFELYQESGVREYWVVYPFADYKAIHIYCLENGKYIAQPPIIEGDTVTSIAFPSLSFSTKELFKNSNRQQVNKDNTFFINLVEQWNKAHNDKNIEQFGNLYAKEVLFYTELTNNPSCIEKKMQLFKRNPDFYQQLNGNIEVEEQEDGTIKCSFIKSVTLKNKTNDYPSYLVFKKDNDEWHIVTEGDLTTDKNITKKREKLNNIS